MTEPTFAVTRRTALAGAAGGGAAVLLAGSRAALAQTSGAASLGAWDTDAQRLPVYRFAANIPVVTTTPAGKPYPLEPDPTFLLGNYDLTFFAFASGRFQLVSGERGWVRLNEPTPSVAGNGARITIGRGDRRSTHTLLGIEGVGARAAQTTRSFGCGTARYRFEPEPRVAVERVLSVPPSTATDRAQPAVVVTIRVTNNDTVPLDIDYVETVLSNPTVVLNRAPVGGERPVTFANTASMLPGGRGVRCDAKATSEDPGILTPIDAPNRYNLYPPSLVLTTPAGAASEVTFGERRIDRTGIELSARTRFRLAPGASKDVTLVFALQSQERDPAPLQAFVDAIAPSPTGEHFRDRWAAVLAPLAKVPDENLRAELLWDGHALLAMATHAAYHRETFIPQGMTYDYHMDLTAAPRDHLQHALAAAYFAPELARSTIRYTLRKMTYQGEIKYTDFGNGDTSNSMWNTSDQQLFLFYAVGEYLRITRDWDILEDETPYLPREAAFNGTTLQKLERAFAYLRDEVGTGPHGLVRLMNSDWSDMVYVDIPVHRYFSSAESQMNSAMVMAVMPELIEQLTRYAKVKGGDTAAAVGWLTRSMQLYIDRISAAMMRDMEGRSYARRVWLDTEKALGDDNMHLEPQSFLLQAPGFPKVRKRELYREMQRRLIAGEVLGPRQRETPIVGGDMQPGTSENGGFWYALAGQTIAGVATFDTKAALALLDRMTFRHFARAHPDYWVGRWTAPDTINAEMCGDLAGLPRPDNGGLWSKMAVYCAHAHAWPIYTYFRIRDLA